MEFMDFYKVAEMLSEDYSTTTARETAECAFNYWYAYNNRHTPNYSDISTLRMVIELLLEADFLEETIDFIDALYRDFPKLRLTYNMEKGDKFVLMEDIQYAESIYIKKGAILEFINGEYCDTFCVDGVLELDFADLDSLKVKKYTGR